MLKNRSPLESYPLPMGALDASPGGGAERFGDCSGPGPPKKDENLEVFPVSEPGVEASCDALAFGLTKEKKLSTSFPFGVSCSAASEVSTSPCWL